jgi:hypothetical protein
MTTIRWSMATRATVIMAVFVLVYAVQWGPPFAKNVAWGQLETQNYAGCQPGAACNDYGYTFFANGTCLCVVCDGSNSYQTCVIDTDSDAQCMPTGYWGANMTCGNGDMVNCGAANSAGCWFDGELLTPPSCKCEAGNGQMVQCTGDGSTFVKCT